MTLPTKHQKETELSHHRAGSIEQIEHWLHEAMPPWHPFRRTQMDWSAFESAFEGKMLKADIIDREKEVLVRAELPGVNKDDIDITVEGQRITIKASTRVEDKKEDGDYFRHEISSGDYRRSFVLPTKVESDKAKTTFKDGVMELTLPKSEPSNRQKIKVK